MGDLARVQRWFDETGAPALGDVDQHYPHKGAHKESYDTWGVPPAQKVLDTALAWSVINRHFDVADFLLAHGADLDTRWNSHEPASILHHLTSQKNSYESMQYLIDRGIDMTIEDYRWSSNAHGNDPKMAEWLADGERRRNSGAAGTRRRNEKARDCLMRFPTSIKRDPAIDVWMNEHAGELGTIARRWFQVMRECGDDVRELLHDGHPTACVGDAAFGYVNAFTAHVNVGFFRGAEIADPAGLLQGTGKLMRHVKLGPGREVDASALTKLIKTAYNDMRRRLDAM
jgi:hypothetical protein